MNLYGFAGGDPVNFSDPFGLCPTGPEKCSWFGNFLSGIHAGVQGLSNAPAAVNQESSWFKGGRFWGSVMHGFTHPYENIDDGLAAAAGQFQLPGEGEGWTKMRGNQGWRDAEGNFWKKDMKHKDHWDVTDRKANKVREVDFEGNQIWPDGPKNKNKGP